MKTSQERQCFFMSPCQWDHSSGYSCTWICFNIILHNLFHLVHGEVHKRQTCVHPKLTRSTKLWGAQCSPDIAFRSRLSCTRKTNFSSSGNRLIIGQKQMLEIIGLTTILHETLWNIMKAVTRVKMELF